MSISQHRSQAIADTLAINAMNREVREAQSQRTDEQEEYLNQFLWHWSSHGVITEELKFRYPVPDGWENSIKRFFLMGIPKEMLFEAIDVAMENRSVRDNRKFRYTCGVAYTMVKQIEQRTLELAKAES